MVYYKNKKYHLSNLKVHYIEKDEGEVLKFVGQEGKEWWLDFAKQWKDTFELKGFEEVEITKEQISRLAKVNELKFQYGVPYIKEYVMTGDLSKITTGHPLYILKIEEDLEKAKQKDLMSSFAVIQLDSKILELEEKLNEFSK